MSGEMARNRARYRPLKAVVVVLAVVLAVPGADAVVRLASDGQTAVAVGAAERGIDSASLLDAADAFGSLERIEAVAQGAGAVVPEVFSSEVSLLPGARDVRVGSRGDVVGYLVAGECEEVLDEVIRHMEARGWTAVPLGGATGATFVKGTGDCTWALVTCTQVDASTAVVVRSVAP